MVLIRSPEGTSRPLPAPLPVTPFRYALHGMCLVSDVLLPFATSPTETDSALAPEVVIRRREGALPPQPDGPRVAAIDCPLHGIEMIERRGPGGVWIWMRAAGTFHIGPDAGAVDLYPDEDCDERTIALSLSGAILLFVRHRLGRPSLHAGAVVTPYGAIAFLGERGRGKSTITASFLRRGAVLLTDDALALTVRANGVFAEPGPPVMKVWEPTAHHALELDEDLPNLTKDVDKKVFSLDGRYPVASEPAHLRTIYVLNRYDPAVRGRADTIITALHGPEALVALLKHTSDREYLLPADDALALPVYARLASQAHVRCLSYPNGFEYQDAVHARILQDLSEREPGEEHFLGQTVVAAGLGAAQSDEPGAERG